MSIQRQILGNNNRMYVAAARITIGASGAPTLPSNVKGIKSVTRNSAGKYTIVLDQPLAQNLGVDVAITPSAPTAPSDIGVCTWDDSAVSTTGTVILYFATRAAPTTPADPPNPSVISIVVAGSLSDVG